MPADRARQGKPGGVPRIAADVRGDRKHEDRIQDSLSPPRIALRIPEGRRGPRLGAIILDSRTRGNDGSLCGPTHLSQPCDAFRTDHLTAASHPHSASDVVQVKEGNSRLL